MKLIPIILILSLSALSAMAEETQLRSPTSYRPKSLQDEAAGKDTREALPSLVSPSEQDSDSGVEFGIIYKGELSSVMRGGVKQQSSYLENLDVRLMLDSAKLLGWKGGSLFLYGLGNRGSTDTNAPTVNVGDTQGTSNIQTPSSQFILYEAWYQQMFFEEKVSLLVGMHDLNSEFYAVDSAALFFNASFGIGKEMSQTGVHGPSIFSVTSLAARLKAEPSENFYMQTAIFNAQAGDPNDHEATHIRGFGDDGLLSVSEAGIVNLGRTAKFAVGLWSYDRTFESLQDSSRRVSSKGSYVMADVEIVKDFSAFVKYGRASTESNAVGACLTAGIQWQHLFSESWNDRLGIGMAKAYLGAEHLRIKEAEGLSMSDSETAYEITYRFEVLPWLALQPDFQFVVHPSGNRNINDAQVGTLRVEISM